MIISSSNIASAATVVVLPSNAQLDPAIIVDGDFSSVYIDSLNFTTLRFTFPAPVSAKYVAIGGSNFTTKDVVTVKADTVVIATDNALSMSDSRTMFFSIDETFTVLEIDITGSGQYSVADVSIGDAYTVPNHGEQGGYSRPWTVPNIQNRFATNLQSQPIAQLHKSRVLSGNLSVPNNLMADFDGWYSMIEHATSGNFYILEDDNKFNSYVCFNGLPGTTNAHSQTRSLGVSSLRFSAFARSSEVFL